MEKVHFRNRSWLVHETPEKTWNPPFWTQVENGIWEPHTFNIFDKFLNSNVTYIDVGAWIGPTVMYAAPIVKRAIAIEPDPVAFPILKQHIEINNLKVELFNEAITGFNGEITLGSNMLGASTTRINSNAGGGQAEWNKDQICIAQCSTLQKFIDIHHIDGPLFIKMDIEGAEEDVLQELNFFVTHKPTLYLSLHPFWWKTDKTWEIIRNIGNIYHNVYSTNLDLIDLNLVEPREVLFSEI